MPTRDGGKGSVQVGSAPGRVVVTLCGPNLTDGPSLSLSAESVQELIAALVRSRLEAFGPDWSSSS